MGQSEGLQAEGAEVTPNMKAFLDMLAWSEIGPRLLAISDNGYNVCVGSTVAHPILFHSYVIHPKLYNAAMNSDAAGRYQFLGRYWSFYQKQLALPDVGPDSQDRWAIALIRECKAIDDIDAGRFDVAVHKCRTRWASLPGAGYNQHEHDLAALRAAYVKAGGTLS